MSGEQVVWLLIIGFLVILLGVLVSTWRSHEGEFRTKTPKRKPSARYPSYDAAARREEARRIFKGLELEQALEAIASSEKEENELTRIEAEVQKRDDQSERNALQLVILMGIAIVVGIAYASYKLANAP